MRLVVKSLFVALGGQASLPATIRLTSYFVFMITWCGEDTAPPNAIDSCATTVKKQQKRLYSATKHTFGCFVAE